MKMTIDNDKFILHSDAVLIVYHLFLSDETLINCALSTFNSLFHIHPYFSNHSVRSFTSEYYSQVFSTQVWELRVGEVLWLGLYPR